MITVAPERIDERSFRWSGHLWRKVKLRRPYTCLLSLRQIGRGEQAYRPVETTKGIRNRRIAPEVFEGKQGQ